MIYTTMKNVPELIRNRRRFKASNLSGKLILDIDKPVEGGMLPEPFYKLLNSDLIKNRSLYVVFSYKTPIAWYLPHTRQWRVPHVKYSHITSKHQELAKLAIKAHLA